MKHLQTKTTLSALALAGFTAAAMAQPAFDRVDADADGFISAEEASVIEGLDVSAHDEDGDGKLSPAEYAAAVNG